MALREFKVSTEPITLGDAILNYRAQRGDLECFAELLVSRTDLTMEEVRALEIPEANVVSMKVAEGLAEANVLMALGAQLDGLDG